MRIKSLSSCNLKGFSDFSTEFSDVNVIAGRNGDGKSSVLSFVTGLFGKGNPKMLRPGCDQGYIKAVFVSDDGSQSWNVERTWEPGKVGTPRVESSETGRLGAPSDFLRSLVDSVSIEPISRAMNATEAEQVSILLETLPLKLEGDELESAVQGIDVPGLSAHLKNATRLSGLDAIQAVHDAIYDHRRNVNRDAKTKSTHAAQLMESIPADATAKDWTAELARLQLELNTAQTTHREERERLTTEAAAARADAIEHYLALDKSIDSDIDARIKELEKSRAEQHRGVSDARQEYLDKIAHVTADTLADLTLRHAPDIQRLAQEHGVAQKQAQDQAGHRRTLEIVRKANAESDALTTMAYELTAALDKLKALKSKLLERIPIPALTMEGGAIYLGGIPLSEKNTAERAKFWLKIAAMRAGELGVVCMDGAEAFDSDTMNSVVEAMKKTGLQWFLAKVTDSPMSIERIDA